jgi:hypothetical protein
MLALPNLEQIFNYFIENSNNSTNTPSSAKVIFYPENRHTACYMRIKNIQNLWDNYSPGDLILVEDDDRKTKESLNLVQIGNFAKKNDCRVEGWQDHESYLKEEKIKKEFLDKMDSSIKALTGETLLCSWEESLNYLYRLAKKAEIEAWKNYSPADLADCFTNKKRLTEKKELLNAMELYARKSTVDVILQYFPKHQENLERRLSHCAKSTNGKIHVFNGVLHTDTENALTAKYATKLLDSLKKKNISYFVYQ